jgi:hypothetical protein
MSRLKVTASQSRADFQPLPKGTYDLDIVSVEEATTSNNNPQLRMKMSVMDGEYAGKNVMHFMTITDKTGGFVKEMIDATGIDAEIVELDEVNPEDGKPFLSIDFDPEDFVGKQVRADATVREYEGKENNRFNNFRPIEAQEVAAPSNAKNAQPTSKAAAPAQGRAAAQPASNQRAASPGNQTRRSRSV